MLTPSAEYGIEKRRTSLKWIQNVLPKRLHIYQVARRHMTIILILCSTTRSGRLNVQVGDRTLLINRDSPHLNLHLCIFLNIQYVY
jgi:hypothetical protein